MKRPEEAPDRRYWTAYDHFKVGEEARAMRRAYVYALAKQWWQRAAKRISLELKHAGAQPPKVRRTRAAGRHARRFGFSAPE